MTNPTPPSNHEEDVLNPINIARARHAVAYNASVTQNSYGQPISASSGGFEFNSCFLLILLGIVFMVGSILGGVIGGGLILAANNSTGMAFLGRIPTATIVPSPTPAPAATVTPTATPIIATVRPIEEIIDEVTHSLVTVINRQDSHDAYNTNNDDGRVVGSGVIIDERGYIVTNNHVIKNPGKLSVVLSDGREVDAELIAMKADQDLAVLKINLIKLPTIHWGDSKKIRPGQTVYALGSPLGDFPNSVSAGIVSGMNRALEMDGYVIDNLIQTDAAINRGSSGGPLINMQGEVIGINTFIIRESEERGIAEGIAFSIPSEVAQVVVTTWVKAHSAETEAIPAGN